MKGKGFALYDLTLFAEVKFFPFFREYWTLEKAKYFFTKFNQEENYMQIPLKIPFWDPPKNDVKEY